MVQPPVPTRTIAYRLAVPTSNGPDTVPEPAPSSWGPLGLTFGQCSPFDSLCQPMIWQKAQFYTLNWVNFVHPPIYKESFPLTLPFIDMREPHELDCIWVICSLLIGEHSHHSWYFIIYTLKVKENRLAVQKVSKSQPHPEESTKGKPKALKEQKRWA